MGQHSSLALVVFLLSLALIITSLLLVFSTHQVRANYAHLQSLELERWQLQEDYTRLLLEINTWAAPHRVHEIATYELSMRRPDLNHKHVVLE